jgi:Mg2+-importing ATPase
MDLSIIEFARQAQLTDLWNDYKKIDEIPFDFTRRRMSVAVEDKTGQVELITKGAIEEMLAVSVNADYEGEIVHLSDELRGKIVNTCRSLNEKGMRVLEKKKKTVNTGVVLSVADESEMTFAGYLAFLDPPKDSATAAIKA